MRRLRLAVAILLGATGVATAAPEKSPEPSTRAIAARVNGRVIDAAGTPVRGASISVEGTERVVMTDGEGRFAIEGLLGASLVIMKDGYGVALGSIVEGPI